MGPSQKIVVFGSFCFFQVFFLTAPPLQKKGTKSGVTKVDHWGGVTILYIYIHNYTYIYIYT